jgi:cell division protein FtsN
MAKRKSTSKGSTFYGLIAGLLIGLSAAAAVAYFVMSSPMPFVDRASRSVADREISPDQSPDPNRGLVPAAQSPTGDQDALGELIATLPAEPEAKPPLPAPPPVPPSPPPAAQSDAAPTNYYLQVGAFRVLEDAEALSGRMLLLGLPVQIQRAEVNGVLVNRVRVGPYARLDDMNAARAKLATEKISANVVRQ